MYRYCYGANFCGPRWTEYVPNRVVILRCFEMDVTRNERAGTCEARGHSNILQKSTVSMAEEIIIGRFRRFKSEVVVTQVVELRSAVPGANDRNVLAFHCENTCKNAHTQAGRTTYRQCADRTLTEKKG